mmetsp:Transcript_23136/g.47318  ORF Transcript_23136/g.47318 Transcript_23136/m.47318 type:complete len:204 (+) Transcript_23136:481-1092(+)
MDSSDPCRFRGLPTDDDDDLEEEDGEDGGVPFKEDTSPLSPPHPLPAPPWSDAADAAADLGEAKEEVDVEKEEEWLCAAELRCDLSGLAWSPPTHVPSPQSMCTSQQNEKRPLSNPSESTSTSRRALSTSRSKSRDFGLEALSRVKNACKPPVGSGGTLCRTAWSQMGGKLHAYLAMLTQCLLRSLAEGHQRIVTRSWCMRKQ